MLNLRISLSDQPAESPQLPKSPRNCMAQQVYRYGVHGDKPEAAGGWQIGSSAAGERTVGFTPGTFQGRAAIMNFGCIAVMATDIPWGKSMNSGTAHQQCFYQQQVLRICSPVHLWPPRSSNGLNRPCTSCTCSPSCIFIFPRLITLIHLIAFCP